MTASQLQAIPDYRLRAVQAVAIFDARRAVRACARAHTWARARARNQALHLLRQLSLEGARRGMLHRRRQKVAG